MNRPEGEDAPLAVITGGASGIGAAIAGHFHATGWRVIIADIADDKGAAMVAAHSRAWAMQYQRLDVSDERSVLDCAADICRNHGPVTALINSAGILQGATRVLDMDMSVYDGIMAVNLRGALLCSRAFGKQMAAQGQGSIVNICSIASLRPGPQPAYAVSKTGLVMLTEILAAELGPSGVRVNAVAPGYTLTPLMQSLIDRGERNAEAAIGTAALRRMVMPQDVADGISFLCSPQAAAITGVVLPIDCGWLVGSAYGAFATQPA